MLPDKANDLLPLLVMLESIGKIEIYAAGFTTPEMLFYANDQLHFNASLLLLLNIGEQSNKLSAELRRKHSLLPFQEIRNLRNRIAHDYTGIDYEMVFDIIKERVPAFKLQLMSLLTNEVADNTFDRGELEAARQSTFYKHVEFEKILS
ncbi:DUF86 domain-containing protein [Telluribacter sp.]|jgi:uncharacterized protein with HEPN domain|uniref:HepT-like ribonuclease domain-containing protein n=1 Tax=Telluribacter sp. TaxID=1978767 RepID=UPI002E0FB647|nr:HepT-like ribonuclease domain-containing protein [Telluribacter sp.]